MSQNDPINPKHYRSHPSGIECIQITEHMSFCLGNAIKYIWRADEKGASMEDLKKARWYIEREIARREDPMDQIGKETPGKLPTNFVVIDCETTGLRSERHQLLSIGAVRAWDRKEFYSECAVQPGATIDPKASAVNGYDPDSWKGQGTPKELVARFLDWLDQPPFGGRWLMGGKNPSFDWSFLNAVEPRLSETISRRLIDLHSWAYLWEMRRSEVSRMADSGFSTDQIYSDLGFEPEPLPHIAITGAKLAMMKFQKIFEGGNW